MRRSIAALSIPFLLFGLPTAAGQLDPTVDECTQQCDAKAEDVNGPTPKTGAETVKSILYLHFKDTMQDALVNTQRPCDECPNREEDLQASYLMPTVVTGPAAGACCHYKTNDFGAVSSGGFVEIVDGEWRSHTEAGTAEDIEILDEKIPLYFYLSTYPVPRSTSESPAPGPNAVGVMPNVAVKANITSGRFPGRGHVIAEGDSATSGRVNMVFLPGDVQSPIYEIRVDLVVREKVLKSVWNGGEGYALEITPYQIHDPASDVQVTQADWRVHVGPKTPPHMVVTIANPLVSKAAKLNLYNNNLFIRWSLTSPWGSYDLDDRSVGVQVTGPTNPDPTATGLSRPSFVKHFTDHNGHFKPSNFTWKFDYRKAGLEDGTYNVLLSAMNLQGTYRLEVPLTFRVVDGMPVDVEAIGSNGRVQSAGGADSAKGDAPGLAPLVAVAALAAVAVARRMARGRRPDSPQ